MASAMRLMVSISYTEGDTMGNSNLKGRATAAFDVEATNEGGTLFITITADSTSEEWTTSSDTVQGTVALGRAVAELGKVATPITAADRRFESQVKMYVDAGLGVGVAVALARQVNSL